MSKKEPKVQPKPTRTSRTIEIFTVLVPGKVETDPVQRYHFTSHDTQVTADGVIYIPLSTFDQARWAELCKESNGQPDNNA